jgi:hypothetical protein
MTRIEKIKNHIKNHSGAYIVAALAAGLAIGGTRLQTVNTNVTLKIDEDFITNAYHDMQEAAGFKVITEPDPDTDAGRDLIALIENHNSRIKN